MNIKPPHIRLRTLIALALLTLLAAGPASRAQSTAPADGAQVAPLTTEQVDAMLEQPYPGEVRQSPPPGFTEPQWADIRDVTDGSRGHDEDAYYLLLEKVDKLEPESVQQKVTYEQLMADPKDFRAEPVRITLRYLGVNSGTTARPQRVRKVWDIVAADYRDGKPRTVVVTLPHAPPEMGQNAQFEVVGYFYKIENFPERGGIGNVDVPVVIAAGVTPTLGGTSSFQFDGKMVVLTVMVVLLIAAWLYIRMKMGRARGPLSRGDYRPRRFEMTDEEIERSKLSLPPEQPGEPAPPSQNPPDSKDKP